MTGQVNAIELRTLSFMLKFVFCLMKPQKILFEEKKKSRLSQHSLLTFRHGQVPCSPIKFVSGLLGIQVATLGSLSRFSGWFLNVFFGTSCHECVPMPRKVCLNDEGVSVEFVDRLETHG